MSDPVTRFALGCVGEPGARVFYVQVDQGGETYSYLLEKGQVAAITIEAMRLLRDLGVDLDEVSLSVEPVAEPESVEFRVADFTLDFDETTGLGRVVLMPTATAMAAVEHAVTAAQLAAAARLGAEAVASGRPLCPRCGLAIDAAGHACPAGNGDLRLHRP